MTPVSRHPNDSLANYRAPLPPVDSGGEFGRDLAIAWAALTARRDTAKVTHRITVLRPLVIPEVSI